MSVKTIYLCDVCGVVVGAGVRRELNITIHKGGLETEHEFCDLCPNCFNKIGIKKLPPISELK